MTRAVGLTWLRWAMITVFVAGVAAIIPSVSDMSSPELVIVPFLAYGVLGVRITGALPHNPIGWVFLFVGVMMGLAALAGTLIDLALSSGQLTAWWAMLGAWINGWFWYPLFIAATVFTLLLFPTGLPSPRWRPIMWLTGVVSALFTLSGVLAPVLRFGDDPQAPTTPNPLPAELFQPVVKALDVSESAGGAIMLTLLVVSMLAPILRYRRGTVVEREQLRWFAFAAIVLVTYVPVAEFVLPDSNGWLNDALFALVLTLVPVSCGLAILRYRLFEIDRVISRTVAYAVVTGVVVSIYAAVVTTATRLLPISSDLAVAAATLTAAALARPLLRRVRARVDRRFDRTSYDRTRAVAAFSSHVQNTVDPAGVQQNLVEVLHRTLQPRELTVWVRDHP